MTIPDSVTRIGESAFYGTAYYNNSANWEANLLFKNYSLTRYYEVIDHINKDLNELYQMRSYAASKEDVKDSDGEFASLAAAIDTAIEKLEIVRDTPQGAYYNSSMTAEQIKAMTALAEYDVACLEILAVRAELLISFAQ